jgi:hypothetical protein
VPGFLPNRIIKPVPVEGNWLWRLIMTLAQHSVPVMWSVEENRITTRLSIERFSLGTQDL